MNRFNAEHLGAYWTTPLEMRTPQGDTFYLSFQYIFCSIGHRKNGEVRGAYSAFIVGGVFPSSKQVKDWQQKVNGSKGGVFFVFQIQLM